MILSPEDHRLRKVLRDLVAENVRDRGQKIIFVNPDLEVREVLYEQEIADGGHILIRDRLLDQAKLRAILHLGLVQDGYRRAVIHVVDPDSGLRRSQEQQLDELMTLRQSNNRLVWVPTPAQAREAWREVWFPTT
jgi:hypothetical protein